MDNIQFRQVIKNNLFQEIQFVESQGEIKRGASEVNILPDFEKITTIINLISPLVCKISSASGSLCGLEIGTGYGGLIRSLALIFPELKWYGLEHPEREYLKKEVYWRLVEQLNCSLTLCDITREKLPFADNFFHLITFSEVLEHLPAETVMPVMNEIWRILDKGGYLVITSPNQVQLLNRIQLLRGKSILSLPITLEYAKGTFLHIHLYTKKEVAAIVSSVGFEVQQIVCKSRFLKYSKGNAFWKKIAYKLFWFFDILSRVFTDNLADTLYIVCQKPRSSS